MTEATELICDLIDDDGVTSRRIILDTMETDLNCSRKIAEKIMKMYRRILMLDFSTLSDRTQRKLK